MNDLISRQAAIDLLKQMRKDGGMIPWEGKDVFARIRKLPPAQPEIIRCKDCKHFIREDVEEYTPYGYDTHFHAFCDKHWDEEQGEYIDVNLDDYCSFAERREVTT